MKLTDIIKLDENIETDVFEDDQLNELFPSNTVSKIKGTLGLDNESAIIDRMLDLIRENCKSYLAMAKVPLFRGMAVSINNGVIGKFDAITRNSKTVPPEYRKLNDDLDEWFSKHFGFPFRSKGVFASVNKRNAEIYSKGEPFLIFPIGETKLCHSEKVISIATIPRLINASAYNSNTANIDEIISSLDYTLAPPTENTSGEIMIACKQYYAINANSPEAKYIVKKLFS